MKAQVSLEAEMHSVKHAKDIRREYEKQNQGLKDEVDQLRRKYNSDATAMQKLQDELIALEKSKTNVEFEYKQLISKVESDKKTYQVIFDYCVFPILFLYFCFFSPVASRHR